MLYRSTKLNKYDCYGPMISPDNTGYLESTQSVKTNMTKNGEITKNIGEINIS